MNIGFKKIRILTAVAATFGLLMFTSCRTQKNASSTIIGDWNIVSVNGAKVDTSANDRNPFIHFEGSSGRIYGNTGCNNLMGNCVFDHKKGTVSFSQLGSTMMSCPDMDTEMSILKALEKSVYYNADQKGIIKLMAADGTVILTLAVAPK